jgi:hypothetical protein
MVGSGGGGPSDARRGCMEDPKPAPSLPERRSPNRLDGNSACNEPGRRPALQDSVTVRPL